MRIVFLGADSFACPIVQRLAAREQDELAGIVTQPERPKGRRRRASACPVHALMREGAIPIRTPTRVNEPDNIETVRAWRPDLIVVAAYGQILKAELLALPPLGCVNVHASLLPKHRGAAPIQWALARGEAETGITTIYMNEAMDEGDIILQHKLPIDPDDTGGTLRERLAALGVKTLEKTLELLRAGTAPRTPQNHAEASNAPKLKKQDGRIDWRESADSLRNRIRAFNPWPGCTCTVPLPSTPLLKVLRTRVERARGEPGSIQDISKDGLLVQTGSDAIRLLEVQPQGGKIMDGGAYARGRPLKVGDLFS